MPSGRLIASAFACESPTIASRADVAGTIGAVATGTVVTAAQIRP